MAERMPGSSPFENVEALVLSAGSYVRASSDLRPRVLETARIERRQRRGKRWVVVAAAAALLLMLASASLLARRGFGGANRPAAYIEAGMAGGHHSTWRLADLFAALREKQSEAITPTPAE